MSPPAAEHALDRLREIAAQVLELEIDEVTPDAYFVDDLDVDSLQTITLFEQVEREFEVRLPPENVARMHSLTHVVDYLKSCGVITS